MTTGTKCIARELCRQNTKYASKRIAQYTVEQASVMADALTAFTRFVIGSCTGKYISNQPLYPGYHSNKHNMVKQTYINIAASNNCYSYHYIKRLCK